MRKITYDTVQKLSLDDLYKDKKLLLLYGPFYLMHYGFIKEANGSRYDYKKASYSTSPLLKYLIDIANMKEIFLATFFGGPASNNTYANKNYMNHIIDVSKGLIHSYYIDLKNENRNIASPYLDRTGIFYSMYVKACNLVKAHLIDRNLNISEDLFIEKKRNCHQSIQDNIIRFYNHEYDDSNISKTGYTNLCSKYLEIIEKGKEHILEVLEDLLSKYAFEIFTHNCLFITDDDRNDGLYFGKDLIPRELMRLRNCDEKAKHALLYYTLVYSYLSTEENSDLNKYKEAVSDYDKITNIDSFAFNKAIESVLRFDMPSDKVLNRMMENK